MTTDLDVIVATWCMSEFKGCLCGLPKGHDGTHRCGSALGLCHEWTDEQADQWREEWAMEHPDE